MANGLLAVRNYLQTGSVIGNYIAALELFKKAEAENEKLVSTKCSAAFSSSAHRGHDRS